MTWDDTEDTKKTKAIEIGSDLSRLSVSELEDYIASLRAEIERALGIIKAKQVSRDSADAIFKTKD